jgi:general secretion pathway protein D
LREGEASILGGIQNKQESANWAGVPGLSAIPILKYIFGSKDHQIQDDDIVFVVVPHIVRSQELDQANLRPIDTGSGELSIQLRHGDNDNSAAASPAVPMAAPVVMPVARPAAAEPATLGSIPAQGALEAAPQMLAQLRADMGSTGSPGATAQAAVPQPNLPTTPVPGQPPAMSALPIKPAPAAVAPAPPVVNASVAVNVPATPMATGASFQVPVVLNGGSNVSSVGLQLHFDPAKLQLINETAGEFLGRDGQPTGMTRVEDPPGTVIVSMSRPPGTHGVTGTGVVCVLTFQAKASGQAGLGITRFSVNGAEQQAPAQTGQATVVVK